MLTVVLFGRYLEFIRWWLQTKYQIILKKANMASIRRMIEFIWQPYIVNHPHHSDTTPSHAHSFFLDLSRILYYTVMRSGTGL